MTTLLAFIFVLGVLVFVHEAGHFLTAKWVGVRVKQFSLGFPPKIIGRTWGDTEYRIGALPLGGYVKMAGDNPMEATGDPEEFMSRSKWERLAILWCRQDTGQQEAAEQRHDGTGNDELGRAEHGLEPPLGGQGGGDGGEDRGGVDLAHWTSAVHELTGVRCSADDLRTACHAIGRRLREAISA